MKRTINEGEITAALSGKVPDDLAESIVHILCRGPESYPAADIAVAAMARPAPRSPVLPGTPPPYMIELPARLFNGKWLNDSMRARFDLFTTTDFYADSAVIGLPACEPIYLAAVLRETYGTEGLPERVEEYVFSQPAYGLLKSNVEPILKKYIY